MHRHPRDAVGGGHYETIVGFQGLEVAESGGGGHLHADGMDKHTETERTLDGSRGSGRGETGKLLLNGYRVSL